MTTTATTTIYASVTTASAKPACLPASQPTTRARQPGASDPKTVSFESLSSRRPASSSSLVVSAPETRGSIARKRAEKPRETDLATLAVSQSLSDFPAPISGLKPYPRTHRKPDRKTTSISGGEFRGTIRQSRPPRSPNITERVQETPLIRSTVSVIGVKCPIQALSKMKRR